MTDSIPNRIQYKVPLEAIANEPVEYTELDFCCRCFETLDERGFFCQKCCVEMGIDKKEANSNTFYSNTFKWVIPEENV